MEYTTGVPPKYPILPAPGYEFEPWEPSLEPVPEYFEVEMEGLPPIAMRLKAYLCSLELLLWSADRLGLGQLMRQVYDRIARVARDIPEEYGPREVSKFADPRLHPLYRHLYSLVEEQGEPETGPPVNPTYELLSAMLHLTVAPLDTVGAHHWTFISIHFQRAVKIMEQLWPDEPILPPEERWEDFLLRWWNCVQTRFAFREGIGFSD